MKICSSCQVKNQPESKFCYQCGASLTSKTLRLQTLLNQRYQIGKKLAEGGMGAVYIAEDMQLFGRTCVIKEMLPYYLTPEEKVEAEQKFRREAELLANLNHPGTPQVYEYFVEQDRYYLVMQYVEGEDLEARQTRIGGAFPEPEVVNFGRQLASTLTYISQQNPPVIHRDIKPANIILEQATGQLKLVDFGIAKSQQPAIMKTTPMGTLGYAPPEQYRGQTEPRSDVFALGATLHHLVTGRDPRNEAPFDFPPVRTIVPTVTAEFETVIQSMLERDVANRPDAAQLKTTFENLGQGIAVRTGPFALRSGGQVSTPQELGLACEKNWSDGVFHLYQGHFEAWLKDHNRHDLADKAGAIRQRNGDKDAGLEEFLHTLVPTMPFPVLTLGNTILEFGSLERGNKTTLDLVISNTGRGYLFGDIKPLVSWVSINEQTVGCRKSDKQTVHVTIDTAELEEGQRQVPILEISGNGGQQRVAARLIITWPPKLALQPEEVDFGNILMDDHGKMIDAYFTISNAGGGVLNGNLTPPVPWLAFSHAQFHLASGQSMPITVTADTGQLPAFKSQLLPLTIQAGSEILEIPTYIGIRKTWYDTNSRIMRWAGYAAFVIAGFLGWVYAFGFIAQKMIQKRLPFGYELNDLIWLGAALIVPFFLFYLAGRLRPQLDEIEAYYYRGDLAADTPDITFDTVRNRILFVSVVLLGLLVGGSAGLAHGSSDSWWYLLLGGISGVLIGGGLAFRQLGWFRIFLAGWGGALLGMLLGTQGLITAYTYGLGSMVLVALLEPAGQPLALRWWLVRIARPALVFVYATGGVFIGQAMFGRFLYSPFFIYGRYNPSGIFGTLQATILTATGLTGALLGFWLGFRSGENWRTVLQTNRLFIVSELFIGLLVFIPLQAMLGLFGVSTPLVFLILATIIFGGLGWLALNRRDLVEKWSNLVFQRLSVQAARIQGPGWANQRLLPLQAMVVQNPFVNLETVRVASIVAALLAVMPYLTRMTWGLLLLLIIVGIVAAMIGVIVYLFRQNRP